MRRYLILGPIWTHRSGGVVALYHLQRALIREGYDCVYYAFGHEKGAQLETNDQDIVIYPEVVSGNPLGAKHVVRWLLNTPKLLGGDGIFEATDMLFNYLPSIQWPGVLAQLFVSSIDETITNLGYDRDRNYAWVYKGWRKPRIPLDAIELVGPQVKPYLARSQVLTTKQSLLDSLQHCKTLYTYDDKTALAFEARLSGCEVLLIEHSGKMVPYPFHSIPDAEESRRLLLGFIKITQERARSV